MPRIQVYLPDDLYDVLKSQALSPSELLQDAVRAEVRRQQLLAEGDRYLKELTTRVGAPTARERARANAVVKRATIPPRKRAG